MNDLIEAQRSLMLSTMAEEKIKRENRIELQRLREIELKREQTEYWEQELRERALAQRRALEEEERRRCNEITDSGNVASIMAACMGGC